MGKHTPGPWTNDRSVIKGPDGVAVAEVWLRGVTSSSGPNARLIAAAPELLEALRPFASLLRHFDGRASRPTKGPIHSWASGDVDGGEPGALTVEMLRAAAVIIAKATGEGA